MVVVAALLFRQGAIPFDETLAHAGIVLNLLAGSLVGAWFAAGHAIRLSGATLNRLVLILLTTMAVLMFAEGLTGLHGDGRPLFDDPALQIVAGVAAGLVIGAVAALLGVAGGELLIPTLVLLFGVDIKLAGSLSLAVSLPTMIVGLMRYRSAAAFSVLARERPLLGWMAVGSITGVGLGGLLLGMAPAQALTVLLSVILAISAIKAFRHHTKDHRRADQANDGRIETGLRYDKSMKPAQDTPRLALDLLPWRVNVVILLAVLAVALVAWQSTIAQAHGNARHGDGIGTARLWPSIRDGRRRIPDDVDRHDDSDDAADDRPNGSRASRCRAPTQRGRAIDACVRGGLPDGVVGDRHRDVAGLFGLRAMGRGRSAAAACCPYSPAEFSSSRGPISFRAGSNTAPTCVEVHWPSFSSMISVAAFDLHSVRA